jgi:hypothetical protein
MKIWIILEPKHMSVGEKYDTVVVHGINLQYSYGNTLFYG